LYDLYAPACCFDFFAGICTDLVDPDRQGSINLPLAEKLDAVPYAFDETAADKRRLVDNTPAIKSIQITNVDRGDAICKHIGKAPFGETAMDGHLAALISRPNAAA
jgi:hypothetical protein